MSNAETLLLAAVLAVVPSLIYLVILNAIDRYEKEPWTILLACVGLGALAAPVISTVVLGLAGRGFALRPEFAPGPGGADPLVGIVQELAKGLLLIGLVHTIRDEFDDVLDGVVYGAAIGAGFGAAESFVFALGGVSTLTPTTLIALLVSGLNHAFYTAILGAFVGGSQRIADRAQGWLVVGYGVATSAMLHSLHDTLPYILSRVANQPEEAIGVLTRLIAFGLNVLGIITIAVIVALAWRREARILREQLAEEVTAGLVTEIDYQTIGSIRGRLGRQAGHFRSGAGLDGVMDLRRLYAAEGELAFHKWRMTVRHRRQPPATKGDQLRQVIRSLQEEIGGGSRA